MILHLIWCFNKRRCYVAVTSIRTSNVWASSREVAGNPVRQLLVPAGELALGGASTEGTASNAFGVWPIAAPGLAADAPLALQVSPMMSRETLATWLGSREGRPPGEVLRSYKGAIGFRRPDEPGALRRPQIGALHAVVGYWTSALPEPGIVVMPTGTGKTETMIAVMVAARPQRLLVLVPTAALRSQLAAKFETLGVLQREGIVAAGALRPSVGRLEHGLGTAADADELGELSNVIVATPQALDACTPEARERLLASFTHLVVDEAHHAPAASWAQAIGAFAGRPVLLFTATPFREDGRSLPGRLIYRFPLREAQRDGYFTTIDYKAVLSLVDTDRQLAQEAVARLRADLAQGFDHVLMARVSSVDRAKAVVGLYEEQAPDLGPAAIYSAQQPKRRAAAMKNLGTRACRIVICVDMLGEGFDLPALKIAAIHNAKKSLGPMIQFIGRFSRTSADHTLGTASVFVARDPEAALSPLRDLLAEDADWNLLLRDITDRTTAAVEDLSAFEASFIDGPGEVAVTSLVPKMSAIAHRAPSPEWNPLNTEDVFPREVLLGSRVAIGSGGAVAWFVVERTGGIRWGDVHGLIETSFELVIMYFDSAHRILYVNSSANSSDFSDLARAVLGDGARIVSGPSTYRVLHGLERLVPTNVGLLDVVNQFRRFSMHVGPDVMEAFEESETHTKSQTHIATSGFDDGERVSISAALSGRFWSARSARNLKEWVDWCDKQGGKLLDESIRLEDVLDSFVIPQDVTERPPFVLLAAEWPWQVYLGTRSTPSVEHDGARYLLPDVQLDVTDHGTSGPFGIAVSTSAWRLHYEASVDERGLTYAAVGADADVVMSGTSVPLSDWLNANKPTLVLEGDRVIGGGDRLLARRAGLAPYARSGLEIIGWNGVDRRVEAQGRERRPDSIQAFMSRHLQEIGDFTVLLDDDGSGEVADLVGLTIEGGELLVTLVHCKYSAAATAGARLQDLYEVCGQAMRSAKWRQNGLKPLLTNLDRRARQKAGRTGESPFEVGDVAALFRVREVAPQLRPRFRVVIAQPGLSAGRVTDDQLQLLAGAAAYLRSRANASLVVYCDS